MYITKGVELNNRSTLEGSGSRFQLITRTQICVKHKV